MPWIVLLGVSTAALWLWLNRHSRRVTERERREMQHHVEKYRGGNGL